MSIIELVNIDKYSHEEAIITFITKTELNKTKTIVLQRMTMETALIYTIRKQVYILILLD